MKELEKDKLKLTVANRYFWRAVFNEVAKAILTAIALVIAQLIVVTFILIPDGTKNEPVEQLAWTQMLFIALILARFIIMLTKIKALHKQVTDYEHQILDNIVDDSME